MKLSGSSNRGDQYSHPYSHSYSSSPPSSASSTSSTFPSPILTSCSSSPPSQHYTLFPTTSTNHTNIPSSSRSLPHLFPIPLPPSPTPPPAYSFKSPPGLRLDQSSTSPISPIHTNPPRSRSKWINKLLLATVPHSLLPTSVVTTDWQQPPFHEYPKSPSLMRPHPTTRHNNNHNSPHKNNNNPTSSSSSSLSSTIQNFTLPKRWIVLILFLILSLIVYSISPLLYEATTTTTTRSTRTTIGKELNWKQWAHEKVSQKGWNRFEGSDETKEKGENLDSESNELEDTLTRTADEKKQVGMGVEDEKEKVVAPIAMSNHRSKPMGGGNHYYEVPVPPPSPVEDSSTEIEAEQEVLNAVVEEAKKEEEQLPIDSIVAAVEEGPKETMIQKVVKPGGGGSVGNSGKKPRKDPSRYKRLLPLNAPSRRYLYGANFIPSAVTTSTGGGVVVGGETTTTDGTMELVQDPEYSNAKVKVPSKKTLARLFKENQKAYEEEIPMWRNFEWKAPPVDRSLERFVEKLNKDDLELRNWIKQLHAFPSAVGVGLGSTSPSSSSLEIPSTRSSSLLATLPSFNRGSSDKYDELLVQAELGLEGKCKSSTWLSSYQKMHQQMLNGEKEPKFISYHCEKGMNCGGLGDRLLGMTSAFFFGLITQRSFLGEWQSPIPLDIVFDSPHVNWSYSSFTSSQHPILSQPALVEASKELDIIHFDRLSVDSTFGSTSWNPKRDRKWTPGFEKRDIAYQSPWIKFFTNRGMIYRSFAYKHLQRSVSKLGLEPSTAFACINQYLFRPKPPALNLISEYTSVLALPSVFSVGIHVRTGDRSMKDAEYDKINTVKRHSQFFRCARELGESYALPSQQIVYYLVTDSANLKQDARTVLGNKLVTTDMVPQHVHQKSGHVDGVFSAVVEDWILAKSDMLVATQDSGFGKLASFMHAKPNTTVTIFPRFNTDVNGLQSKKSHIKVDCTDPNVFTTFEELSSEWSLG